MSEKHGGGVNCICRVDGEEEEEGPVSEELIGNCYDSNGKKKK
jgi:hypothetical protein